MTPGGLRQRHNWLNKRAGERAYYRECEDCG
jgi:hypothetical protein